MHTSPPTDTPAPRAKDAAAAVSLRAAVRTDIGAVRARNEDAAHVDPEGRFFMVADGMGGHTAGDVASAMAVDIVRQWLEAARPSLLGFGASPDEEGRRKVHADLERAVRFAHQMLRERGMSERDKYGMGSTLDVALVIGRELFVAHVGDSRTYLVRDGVATQLTRDHTMANVMRNAGKSTAEVQALPTRNVLLSTIGTKKNIIVDLVHRHLQPGDRLLLCSDGLHQHFRAAELASRMSRGAPDQVLRELVELARGRGGDDNITGLVVEVLARRPHPNTVPRSPAPPPTPPSRPRPIQRTPTATPAPQAPRPPWDDEPTRRPT